MNKVEGYIELLTELGFRPELTSNGNVVFKYQSLTYCLYANESDPVYFQLVCPSFWSVDSAEELQLSLYVASEISRDTKVAKAFVNSDETHVSAAVEMFVADPEHLRPIFARALGALNWSVNEFKQHMHARAERAQQQEQMGLIRRWLQRAIGQGLTTDAGVIFAADYVEHGSLGALALTRGPEQAQAIAAAVHAAFADPRVLIASQVVENDQVVTRWTLTGLHRAPLLDFPPSGQFVTCNAMRIDRVRDGRIVESWTMFERPAPVDR